MLRAIATIKTPTTYVQVSDGGWAEPWLTETAVADALRQEDPL